MAGRAAIDLLGDVLQWRSTARFRARSAGTRPPDPARGGAFRSPVRGGVPRSAAPAGGGLEGIDPGDLLRPCRGDGCRGDGRLVRGP
ncbi:hypothetical protein AB0M20_15305 [Actinoplanes sp. NPDC051633]|uniref:hypothetical protein n=1 Tax=Actinoplanes sp. NPDC051633 TaxID=3155670 RepID=UPI0034215780